MAAPDEDLPATFVQHAADILADTTTGLTGTQIVRATAAYAVEYHVQHLPHPTYPYEACNKRTALYENVMAFSPSQRYRILKELCDHPSFGIAQNSERKALKLRLISRYRHLDPKDAATEVNESLVEETKHWLNNFPEALSLYHQALEKYEHGAFSRNLLDDLRLALEKLLCALFSNEKSLENQVSLVGSFIKSKGGSPELANMFVKLLDYYAKYHNSYVKHDDAVVEEEIEFILEITSSFMKHLIRLRTRG
ncbi:MAG: hypothetical protein IPK78_11035 [Rhodospirillales bacterium]|nr:hypothetical protein [Rhodospirillales bacterium]